MQAKKIIFLNQKGGVGKTTTAVNVGSALAREGYKVLLVDLDSQGNLSSAVSADTSKPGIYEILAGEADLSAVQTTPVDGLFCLSGGINMAGLAIELVDEDNREFFLKNALSSFDGKYDYIFADCPPALDLVTMNALCWANYVIIPMQCEYFAMEGLNLLLRTVNSVKKRLNPALDVLGIVFTMYSKRANLNNEVVEDISTYFKDLVFETKIPRNVRLSEAPSHGLPINAYDNSCSGAKAYAALAKEVISRAY
ncbi:MAG: ParA family protein [Spirochaetales bacterium]|nr:ParA family protein [Spirochaetales bacterium]MBR1582726.1 ParA family protein [Spirochaetales bacterium]